MSKREAAIGYSKFAGFHDDRRAFTRLVIESRVNLKIMREAFHSGQLARRAGARCTCFECSRKVRPVR